MWRNPKTVANASVPASSHRTRHVIFSAPHPRGSATITAATSIGKASFVTERSPSILSGVHATVSSAHTSSAPYRHRPIASHRGGRSAASLRR